MPEFFIVADLQEGDRPLYPKPLVSAALTKAPADANGSAPATRSGSGRREPPMHLVAYRGKLGDELVLAFDAVFGGAELVCIAGRSVLAQGLVRML